MVPTCCREGEALRGVYSLQRQLVLFGEAKENSNVEDAPHQQTRWMAELSYGTKRRHTYKNFGMFSYIKFWVTKT